MIKTQKQNTIIVTGDPQAYRVSLFEKMHLSTALEYRVLVTKCGVVLVRGGSASLTSRGWHGSGIVQASRASSVESVVNLVTEARGSTARSSATASQALVACGKTWLSSHTTSQSLVARGKTRLSTKTTIVGVLAIVLVG